MFYWVVFQSKMESHRKTRKGKKIGLTNQRTQAVNWGKHNAKKILAADFKCWKTRNVDWLNSCFWLAENLARALFEREIIANHSLFLVKKYWERLGYCPAKISRLPTCSRGVVDFPFCFASKHQFNCPFCFVFVAFLQIWRSADERRTHEGPSIHYITKWRES